MQCTLQLQPCAPPTLCEQVAAEEVFEALALYFPIAFTPPPNDPHRITEQHLLQALPPSLTSYALSSYPRRAPLCRRALALPCL